MCAAAETLQFPHCGIKNWMVHLNQMKPVIFNEQHVSHFMMKSLLLKYLKTLKVPTYRRYTGVPRRWSCCSRSWSPPTAADTRPGWRTSPPGRWCWALKTESNRNLVSRALSGGGGMFAPRRNEMSRQRIGNGLLQTEAYVCQNTPPCVQSLIQCFLSNTNANMLIVKSCWY